MPTSRDGGSARRDPPRHHEPPHGDGTGECARIWGATGVLGRPPPFARAPRALCPAGSLYPGALSTRVRGVEAGRVRRAHGAGSARGVGLLSVARPMAAEDAPSGDVPAPEA